MRVNGFMDLLLRSMGDGRKIGVLKKTLCHCVSNIFVGCSHRLAVEVACRGNRIWPYKNRFPGAFLLPPQLRASCWKSATPLLNHYTYSCTYRVHKWFLWVDYTFWMIWVPQLWPSTYMTFLVERFPSLFYSVCVCTHIYIYTKYRYGQCNSDTSCLRNQWYTSHSKKNHSNPQKITGGFPRNLSTGAAAMLQVLRDFSLGLRRALWTELQSGHAAVSAVEHRHHGFSHVFKTTMVDFFTDFTDHW